MATFTQEDAEPTPKFAAVLKPGPTTLTEPPPHRPRRRILPGWLTWGMVLVVVSGGGLFVASRTGLFGSPTVGHEVLTKTVHRGAMIVSITEDGNVESAHNIDIKCEVKGGSTILWLIKDGTEVKQGDELARLDSSSIEDQISQQKITFEKARAAMIEADKTYVAAEIAVREYVEGTFIQSLQDLKAKATVAKENLESAKNSLQFTNKMARKGYVTTLQRDAQAFAVQRAELDLNVAQTAIEVLEKFSKPKTQAGLESTRDTAQARKASEEAAFKLEEDRLKRLELQLEKCTIVAPDNGMVVYANEQQMFGRGGGQQQSMVEEGALMRERQSLLRLPDLARMQVKCTVHESKVDMLQRGMRARIHIQDKDFQGTVTSVANQAEPTNFFSGNVKEYATIVSIDSDPHGLRPGMTSAVEILVASLKDVLTVPVQAVVEFGGKHYCWVRKGLAGFEKRPVTLGMSNNTDIQIVDGVGDGEDVLLNPRTAVEEAREEINKEEDIDVKQKFGDDKPRQFPKDEGKRTAGGPGVEGADKGKAQSGRPGFPDFKSLDKNNDGKITEDEAPDRMKQAFGMIDTNSDGAITPQELGELRKKMLEMQKQGGGPAGP